MRQKKYSIVAMGTSSVLILIAVGFFYYSLLHQTPKPQNHFRRFPEIQAPTEQDMKTVKRLENKLPGIAYPVVADTNPIKMQVFGRYTGQSSNETGQENRVSDKSSVTGYSVTLAVKSGNSGVCMINNTMYKKGDELPCGSIISGIESHRISIDKENKRRWLQVVKK